MTPPDPVAAVDVVLLGDINLDLVLDLAELPLPGGDGVATGQRLGVGGSAANTAIVLSRFGHTCSMLSCVGDDAWGRLALDALATEGIALDNVIRHNSEPTSLNVVAVTPDGERTMLAYRGASAHLTAHQVTDTLNTNPALLHVSGYAFLDDPQRRAALTAVGHAESRGIKVSLDVPVDPARAARETLLQVLPMVDLLVVGLPEAAALTGEHDLDRCVDQLLDLGVRTVAVKLGPHGSLLSTNRHRVRIPACRVAPHDSTGAGDAFAAGAIAVLLAGGSPDQIGLVANATGAAATQVRGAGTQLPGPGDALHLLRADLLPQPLLEPAQAASTFLAQSAGLQGSTTSGILSEA